MSASPREIVRNTVKEKLARGEVVSSITVRLVRSIEIARIAKTAGFDSLYVDVEPFVRVPSTRPEHVSRALDGGALGVIAPHIRSAAEAREVVAAAKYPPFGERSMGGALPHLHYRSFPAAEANAAMNEATMVVVQFETADAIDKAEEIAAVEGVDMVLMGTNDLLADMGLPGQYEHERVREAYARAIAACTKHGKHVGVGGLATRPELAAEFVKMGARYVSTGTDLAFLLAESTARAKQVHEIALR